MLKKKTRSKQLKGKNGLLHAQLLGKNYLEETSQEFGRKFGLLSLLPAFQMPIWTWNLKNPTSKIGNKEWLEE